MFSGFPATIGARGWGAQALCIAPFPQIRIPLGRTVNILPGTDFRVYSGEDYREEAFVSELFEKIDCVELYVADLDEGLKYYRDLLGLRLLWRTATQAGLGMRAGDSELVLQTERKEMNVDFKVDSVEEAVAKIAASGGEAIHGPFDIPIGKCAVVRDKWGNKYVVLDMSKGHYMTDAEGKVVGVCAF
jgi:lactoylglutathione lyase